jgi:ribosomal protein S27AE
MNDDILKKLEQRLNRRSFLRGSGLAAAVTLGGLALPLSALAQDQPKPEDKKDGPQDGGSGNQSTDPRDPSKPENDESKITKKDELGRDYRVCPQCGYNMYRQDQTWTCENCGYSYTE